VGQKLTDPQSLNRYSYCHNNPLTYNDPTGHFALLAIMAIGAIVGAIVNFAIYAVVNHDNITAKGLATAAITGLVTGALCAFAGPLAGSAGEIAATLLGEGAKQVVTAVAEPVIRSAVSTTTNE
jgi:hypothetical protein